MVKTLILCFYLSFLNGISDPVQSYREKDHIILPEVRPNKKYTRRSAAVTRNREIMKSFSYLIILNGLHQNDTKETI